ncbi:hypothetical protein A1354_11235 [Pseudomonas asplenii]|nr:hypothetical protein A1354_11235 [Pseudomonas asplenii]
MFFQKPALHGLPRFAKSRTETLILPRRITIVVFAKELLKFTLRANLKTRLEKFFKTYLPIR